MRVTLQVGPVLEGAGLAFVDIDSKQAGGRLLAHDAPLAPGRETRAAEAAHKPELFLRSGAVATGRSCQAESLTYAAFAS